MKLKTDFGFEYDNLSRFISYHKQLQIVGEYAEKQNKILEIGVGNKTLNSILKNKGYKVKSVDILKELSPDFVADVRKLPFGDNEFDVALAFEILEHIPFDDFSVALNEISRVTKKKILISLPYWNASFEFIVKFPGLGLIKQPPIIPIHVEIPYFFRTLKSKEHYFEIGAKGFSKKLITDKISKIGNILKIEKIPINNHHLFFIVEVKK